MDGDFEDEEMAEVGVLDEGGGIVIEDDEEFFHLEQEPSP
jgi:hypothetical protein